MMTGRKIERQAAEALLDVGVSLPLFTIRLPLLGKRTLRVVMRRPRLGTVIRIMRLYTEMDVTPERLLAMPAQQQIRFWADNAGRLSLAVAHMICGGFISGKVLARPMAWLIRHFVPREYIFGAQQCFMALHSTRDFMPIIAWAAATNPLMPDASRADGRIRPTAAKGMS